MASSSGQILIEPPPPEWEIDLEDLPRQVSSSTDFRRRPSHQENHRSLAMWMAERLRIEVSIAASIVAITAGQW